MILAILQARVSSSRLPGKILLPILGEPMLFRQIERINRCRRIDKLIVATSTDPSDDALVSACKERGIDVGRGSLDDVLQRFIDVARPYAPSIIVRLTGDCPLTDPDVIDATIELFIRGGHDYASNAYPPSYPDGLDVEVTRMSVLEQACAEAKLLSEREHVTLYIRSRADLFRAGTLQNTVDHSHLRWTVDEPADFEVVRAIYEALYPANPNFTSADILAYLDRNPSLAAANSGIARNEGLAKSLAKDTALSRSGRSGA